MQIVPYLLAGSVGLVVGAIVAAYALTVPAQGRLPGLSFLPVSRVRPRGVVVAGAVIACALSLVMFGALGLSGELWVLWLPGLLGIGLAIVDVRQRRLPFLITGAMYALSGLALVVVALISGDPTPAIRALIAGIAAICVFLVVALALPGQLGLGDVVLAGWIALTLGWLGWGHLGVGLLAGLLVQAATAAILIALRRRPADGGLPMGPALLAGWLVGVVGFMTR